MFESSPTDTVQSFILTSSERFFKYSSRKDLEKETIPNLKGIVLDYLTGKISQS